MLHDFDTVTVAMQSPAVFVSQYQSAASFSTKSCQLSVNITDSFSKVLYSGGADVTYSSVQDFITALTTGDFVMGMTPSEQFVQVSNTAVMCMCEAICVQDGIGIVAGLQFSQSPACACICIMCNACSSAGCCDQCATAQCQPWRVCQMQWMLHKV